MARKMSKIIEFRFFRLSGSMGRLYFKKWKTSIVVQNLKPMIRVKICVLGFYLATYFDYAKPMNNSESKLQHESN